MTDLVKVYNSKGAVKSAAKEAEKPEDAIVTKRGQFAIVEKPKARAHRIITPREMSIRDYVWAKCNELQPAYANAENPYRELRRAVIDDAARQGYKLSGIQAEISRWRHRFN